MAVTWNPKLLMRLAETLTVDGADGTQTIQFSEFDREGPAYTDSTPQTVTTIGVDKLSLTAGAATIDLTAIPGHLTAATITMNGLRVVGAYFFAPSTNAGASITVAKGGTNGYELQSTHATIITKSCENYFNFGSRLTAVGGSAKTLDITGTGTDQLWYILVAGAV